jgi:hypothetical protein
MWLMQKLTYFLCKYNSRLQMHLISKGYTDRVLFPTIGKAGDVLSPDIGKLDIYCRIVQVCGGQFQYLLVALSSF